MPRLRRTLALALLAALSTGTFLPTTVRAQDDDWEVKQNPFDPRIVNRYKALLEKNPNDAQALKRLIGLYSKYSTLDKLIGEYEAKHAKKPDNFAFPMILGHLHRHRQEVDKAVAYYEKAAVLRPEDPSVNVALAELYRQQQRIDDAIVSYEKALPKAKSKADKKQILRTLADLALSKKDITKARGYYQQYFDLDPKDLNARVDLADALAKYDLHAEALAEYQAVEKQLGTDPARRVEIMAKVGREQQALGKEDDAIATYRKAMAMTQRGHYLRKDLTERIIEIYRKKQDLRGLITSYEKEWPAGKRGFFEWDVLARLYEEVGEQDKAIEAYRKATKAEPYELDTQRRLIAMLERAGRDDEALAQYEIVIKVAPGEPRFQLELAERYYRRGDKKKALELAKKIAARFPDDPGVHAALADAYGRWNEEKLALKEYEILVKVEPQDETHLVNLGEQYFQRGEKAKAIEIWKKITASKTAESYARLAEIYAEHDMGVEAIETYQKAITMKPKEASFHKGLAGVYERQRQDDRALEEWEKVKTLTSGDEKQKSLRLNARTRIIAIYKRKPGNPLNTKVGEWAKKFNANPPDIEAGYDAAEGYVALGRYENAEAVLKRILDLTPNDTEAMTKLVDVYKHLRRYPEAVAMLKRLVALSPGRERDLYAQISDLEFDQNNDAEAIHYAQLALEKSPNDPQAQERLAEIYEKRGEDEKAIEAYKRAIALNARNHKVHFALARVHIRREEYAEAARLYRDIIRRASDEEVVRNAARKAINLEEYMGTLGALEAEISPLAFLYSQKPVYRRVLIELYARYVPPLVTRAQHGDAVARKELLRLGEHGLKPLLEALADESDPDQQKIAVQVLGYLGNKNAAPALVKLAQETRPSEPVVVTPSPTVKVRDVDEGPGMDVRVEALVSAGRLGDPRIIPALVALAADREAAIKEAAVWALGRTGDAKAVPALIAALADGEKASVQAIACLGLGSIGEKKSLARVAQFMRNTSNGAEARAACAYALGVAGAGPHVADLIAVVAEGNDDVQRKAAWALGRSGDKRALPALLRAYWTKKEALRQTIAWALVRVSKGTPDTSPLPDDDVRVEGGKIDYRGLVKGLMAELTAPAIDPAIIRGQADEIAAGIADALGRHRDMVARVLRDLDARPGGLALGLLTQSLDDAPPGDRAAVESVLETIGQTIAAPLEKLTDSRDVEIRILAVGVLAKTRAKAAPERISKALADDDLRVRVGAMAAAERYLLLGGTQGADLAGAVAARMSSELWEERVAVVDTLGRLEKAAPTAPLTRALTDPSGFVREAAARALGRLKRRETVDALLEASKDELAEVRLAVVDALVAIGDAKAKERLADLAKNDPDERVRAAAKAR